MVCSALLSSKCAQWLCLLDTVNLILVTTSLMLQNERSRRSNHESVQKHPAKRRCQPTQQCGLEEELPDRVEDMVSEHSEGGIEKEMEKKRERYRE